MKGQGRIQKVDSLLPGYRGPVGKHTLSWGPVRRNHSKHTLAARWVQSMDPGTWSVGRQRSGSVLTVRCPWENQRNMPGAPEQVMV